MQIEIELADEAATVAFGARLAALMKDGCTIYLEGTLGAGKTTFCRGVLNALGHSGPVKSPTYTLVEPYVLKDRNVYHFDLYRLGSAEELEYMGIRDYFSDDAICLIEWPERGLGCLADSDMVVEFRVSGSGRTATIQPQSARGEAILELI